MWDKLLVGLAAFWAFLIVYRILIGPAEMQHDYEHRVNDVLTRDDYKVKGRFD